MVKLLTLTRNLQRRKARERHELFVAEGVRTAEALLESPLEVRGALVASTLDAAPRGVALRAALTARGIDVQHVSERELASASDTETPQGVLLIAEVPSHDIRDVPLSDRPRVIVLDAVQDPGNVGAIVRTAAALGADATMAMPGTVDLWNAKVVRSAMGSLFHHRTYVASWEELDELLKAARLELWGADASGEALDARPAPERLALAVGNEGAGLSPQAIARTAHRVAIPIAPGTDSLNVAVAAGILLYSLRA